MTPEYPAAAERIRTWIVRDRLKPGTILPPGCELAARFGLTQAVAARACLVLVSGGLLSRSGRKLKVAFERPSPRATEGVVHVLSYWKSFAQSVGKILSGEGVDYRLIELSATKTIRLEPIVERTLQARPAGVILSTLVQEEGSSAFNLINVPLVVCGERTNPGQSSIRMDAYRGTEKALRHLRELGHRHVAHISEGRDPIQTELADCYRAACHKVGLAESASTIWQAENRWHEIVYDTLRAGRRSHPKVTAVFGNDRAALHAIQVFSVPEEISVVGFGGLDGGLNSLPPMTSVALRDQDAVPSWACAQLIAQIRRVETGLPPKPPLHATLEPDLIERQSTRALVPRRSIPRVPSQAPPAKPDPLDSWRHIYPFLKRNHPEDWLRLDLSRLANHSLKRQYGWLGAEPLLHFPPGLRSIHGVPFQILDEEENNDRAVVTFRSPQAHSAAGEDLPARALIEVNSRVRAIYFLHGCGFVRPLAFAEYRMNFENGGSSTVPLIALGSRQLARDPGSRQPNLQDWWPAFGQEHFPHAHYATVFDPADPAMYERFIYSLEWINPRPTDAITSIEVRVDPKAGPTLALIAVTALLAGRSGGKHSEGASSARKKTPSLHQAMNSSR